MRAILLAGGHPDFTMPVDGVNNIVVQVGIIERLPRQVNGERDIVSFAQ